VQIRFLLGPAGSGKTFRCLSEIRAALKASPDGPPLILLAPKQATFQLERQLLADDSLRGYTRLRILSFERLARFIFDQLRHAPPKMLEQEGRLMVLRALLTKTRDELKLFRASARLTGFAQQLSLVLREFQSNQLTPDALRELAAGTHDSGGLSSKLHDLALLLESYLKWLATHHLLDANCLLSAATEALQSPESKVQSPKSEPASLVGELWLDGFAELSPQELALLVALVPRCERATLAFCLDAEAPTDSWLSHWAAVRKTFDVCRKTLSAVPGATITTEPLPRDTKKTRFTSPALAGLEQSWSNAEFPQHVTRNTQQLRLVTCTDPDAEAIFAAREILKFVRTPRTDKTQNRFRDAAVLVRDLEKYHEPLQRVFLRYEIPFFLDRRESVSHHPLAELTRSALRTVVYQWPHDDWFAALKTGLVPVADLEIDRLENEALARGWKGAMWQEPIHIENDPGLSQQLEALRKKIISPFRKLALQMAACQNRPTGPQLASALRTLWEDLRVEEQLEQWAEATPIGAFAAPSSIHATVWDQMETWLRNISLAFDDESLALRDWLPVLEAGLANLTVGVIPPALDQVLIGAIDRSRNPELKRAFVLGMNEGVFPATPDAPALLTEVDREAIARRGATLGPSLRERMARERYYGYIACTRASEQLAITCARQDARGVALNPSLFISQLQRIFPRAEMEEFSAEPKVDEIQHVFEILPALLRGEVIDSGELRSLPGVAPVLAQWQRWHDLATPEKLALSPAAATALYGGELRTSVSALETFAGCAFQFFVRHGLRADERALFEADPRQTGSFQHEILSRFHGQLRAEKKRWRDLTPQNARERIAALGFELSRSFGGGLFEADERSRFMARALIEQLQNLMAALVGWMRQYEFDPQEVELSFGLGPNDLPAWRLPLGEEKCLVLRGKIDRVDLWRAPNADEALAVIVDYKSSGKKLDPIFLHHGMQLQLLSYLNALLHLPDPKKIFGVSRILPAGVFYVPLRARPESADTRYEVLDRSEASASMAYQHTGRFDGKAILQLDNRGLENGDQFKFARKKDGEFSKRGNEVMTTEAFGALLEKIADDLRSHGERIFAGDIAARPFRKGNERACDWCQCQAVCRFDSWIHPFNVLRKPPEENGEPERKSGE